MQVLDFIKNRRSVHKYKKKKVPSESLYYVLEAGRWAPSSGNIQNWRFIVVEEEDSIKRISKATLGQNWIADAPVLIIVCSMTKLVKSKFARFGERYALQNTSAAVQNMLLAAMGVGLTSCWVTAFSDNRIRRICDVPNNVDIHSIITLGYAAEKPVPQPRHDVWDIAFFEKWSYKLVDKVLYIKGEDSQPLLERKFVKNAKKRIKRAVKRKPKK